MTPREDTAVHEAEAARVLQICNACRYCEGFCAVFPAMTRRLEFPAADVHFLANLCHGCGACLHACQYAPPHEFAVNVPQAMARVRARTWADCAWPSAFGALYQRNGLALALAVALACALFAYIAMPAADGGSFYDLVPHGRMVALFVPAFAFMALAFAIGLHRFWWSSPPGAPSTAAAAEAARDVLALTYLDGGHGEGCNEADDRFTRERRASHHAVFYGFALCFAATAAGTVCHYALGLVAPYGWTSLPKVLGTAGGVLMLAGALGLGRLRLVRHPQQVVAEHRAMDLGFIALLALVAASGLALPFARASVAVLSLHLGAVMALFVTAPYSKMAHGAYRAAALMKWAIEKRLPNRLKLGGE